MKIRKIVSLLVSLFLLVNPVFGAMAETDEVPAAETEETLVPAEGAVQEGEAQQPEEIKVPDHGGWHSGEVQPGCGVCEPRAGYDERNGGKSRTVRR